LFDESGENRLIELENILLGEANGAGLSRLDGGKTLWVR
jgi:hypothetical protein